MAKAKQSIIIKGAKVHNLKNIDLEIPHNSLVVITGLSGSGKSTLAFDTIFAEGQRRYVESLSSYARQFLGRVGKPDVESISGIAPAIAIEQKVNTRNSRSTVGTSTEIYDYLKLLFSRVGKTFSPISGAEVKVSQVDDVVEYIKSFSSDNRVFLGFEIKLIAEQGLIEKLTLLIKDAILRVYYKGEIQLIEDILPTLKGDEQDIIAIVDRAKVAHDSEAESRFRDSVSRCFEYGDGDSVVIIQNPDKEYVIKDFSVRFEMDGISFEQPNEHLFSFNNPLGACPRCEGYGKVVGIDEDLVVPDKTKSIYDNAVACWRGDTMQKWKMLLINNAAKFDFPIHRPFYELTKAQKTLLWRGNEYFEGLDDFFKMLDAERYKIQFRVMLSRYSDKTTCPECEGSRLRKEALYVRIGGLNIAEFTAMSIGELYEFLCNIKLDDYDKVKSERILQEVKSRLSYMIEVGLSYLTLDRLSSTLSGGESQRINLATSLGSNLTGSLYILDEPSIGLHPRDTERLISVLKKLRDLGNTVIVVEHESEVMKAADTIIDIGPGAGVHGGEVVFNGSLNELQNYVSRSLTADYLFGKRKIELPEKARAFTRSIKIKGARENNLKGVDVAFPLGVITCVTGVSGSGKSTLVKNILYPAVNRYLSETGPKPGFFEKLEGDVSMIKRVEMIDQNPIGKSSRSNPVTYIKAYDDIRKLFAEQPYAKHNGMSAANFSFNIAGGRCDECEGEGVIHVGMQFMADVTLVCESCGGKRFKDEVLEVRYFGKTIFDILELTVDDAVEFFTEKNAVGNKRIIDKLAALQRVGLGYVKLGQSSSTLSGGESQRVKLASFLTKDASSDSIMFIFDEPTTGLHFHDINVLLKAFDALISKGHTIVIVEHNVDVINNADWVIDLGPEAGDMGGEVVFEGTPSDLKLNERSYTAKFL
ncbi:MAG: excinuclease ABC subunit UvrA [Rikenellaceae bacterium]